jgi:dipeptidyl aminopeptidase/acylaminoacyl peptidase
VALSPPATPWESLDLEDGFREGLQFEHYTHLFSVDTKSLRIAEVVRRPVNWYQNGTLYWQRAEGEMLIQKKASSYARLRSGSTDWHDESESHLPFGTVELGSGVSLSRLNASSDGRKIIGVLENVRTPPDLFIHDPGSGETNVLTDLNPEYRNLKLGGIENVEWTDDLGFHSTGYLIKPVGFEPGKAYPVVIMVKGWGNFFLADTHFQTAFPPQPLAGAGFLVLMANVLPLDQIPGGYVGKMGEAYQFIAMVKGAVRMLSMRGLADPAKVGLIGFSSTSWQTDFMVTHSDFPFAAVSSADSGIRNYGSYWLLNSKHLMNDYEDVLGGPPYGETLSNTLRFAPAFNAKNVRAPLLMEYTNFPGDLTGNMEFFIALKRQGKPVEMFSYPTGQHDLDTPKQRIASLQRNVDWFRFWMQGLEGSVPPYDPEQYVRWEELKKIAHSQSSDGLKFSDAVSGVH